MPLKNGRLAPTELQVAGVVARTGDRRYAAHVTGLTRNTVDKAMTRPEVQAEIARIQTERLFSDVLPAAVDCLASIIKNPDAPSGARVQAAKIVMDRTLGEREAGAGKEPHEMSGEELARAIAELEREASGRAKDITPPKAAGLFD